MEENLAGVLSWDTTISVGGTLIEGLQSIPSLGGSAEKVEITTLANHARRYKNGLKDYGDLEFKFLYDNSKSTSNYRVLKGFEGAGAKECIVTLEDGTTFTFDAEIAVAIDEAELNAALTFTLTCGLQSDITVGNPQA